MPKALRLVVLAYASALLLLQYHYPGFPSPNERTRLYLLEALLHDHTLAIDAPLARHGDMEDKLQFAGRLYSNKPPGTALLALPTYAIAYAAAAALGRDLSLGAGLYAARLGSVTLPAVLLIVLLARRFAAALPEPRLAAALLAGAAFGTGLLPYGALLMSHATAAALLGAAAVLLLGEDGDAAVRRTTLAALLASAAAACEYPVAIAAAVLLVVHFLRRPSGARALAIVAGGLGPLLLVLGWDALLFGNPLDLGYTHHLQPEFQRIHTHGLLGFGLPTASALHGLLLSSSKGLFAWSPLLLLALPGAAILVRRKHAGAALLLGLPALALVLFLAGYPNWHGGWTVGPRYLLAVVPLLVLLAAEALAAPACAMLVPGLAAAGIVLHALAALTWPFLPDLLENPAFDLSWPLLGWGETAPTLTSLLALPAWPALSLAALAIATAVVVALRPRPLAGAVVASAFLAVAAGRGRGAGEVDFSRAEVLYRMGAYARSTAIYRRILADERPSPMLARHARMRLDEMAAGGPPR